MSNNTTIPERFFGVQTKEEAEAKMRELAASALAIPAAAIPVFVIGSLLTGNPVPLAIVGIPALAATGGFLVFESGKVVIKSAKYAIEHPIESVGNVARSPLSLTAGLFKNVARLADENDKGLLTRALQYLEKRGEADIPQGLKTILNVYEGTIKVATMPIVGAINLYGFAAFLTSEGLGTLTTNRKAAESKKNKDEAEILKQIEDAIIKSKYNALEFERNLDLSYYEEQALELTDTQRYLLDSKSTDLIPVSANAAVEEKNKKYREILTNENLLGQFSITIPEAENINSWNDAIATRKMVTEVIRSVSAKGTEALIDSTDNKSSSKSLVDFYYFLEGNIDALNDKQKASLDEVFQQNFGMTYDQFQQNPQFAEFIKRLSREILLMYKRMSLDSQKNVDVQLTHQDEIVEMMELQITNPTFLPKYKDLWLAGAGVSMGGRDVLQPQDSKDSLNYFRWVTIPTNAEIDIERQRNEGLKNALESPQGQIDFPQKMAQIKALDKDETENALEAICRMNPKETELFFRLSNEIIINPALAQQLKQYFNFFYTNSPFDLNIDKLDQVINDPNLNPEIKNILEEMKALKENSRYFQSIFNSLDQFLANPPVVSPIMLVIETEPFFEAIYEYYGGNVTSFYEDLERLSYGVPNYDALRVFVINKLQNNIDRLDDLEQDINTDPDRVRAERNDHFERVIKGEILIRENLIDGRDHMKYIETLANELTALGIIADPNEILLVVPDIDFQLNNVVLDVDVAQNMPIGARLIEVAELVLNRFMATPDAAQKAKLLEMSQLLNILGVSGRLISVDPRQVEVDYEPKVLKKYLNGIRVGGIKNESIFAKHPYGYEI